MTNQTRRQQLRSLKEAKRWKEQLAEPRHYQESVGLCGIGHLSVRIAALPSFERTVVWELRLHPERPTERLFVSRSAAPGDSKVVGYFLVDADPGELAGGVKKLRDAAALTGPPPAQSFAIADGNWFNVSFHSPIANCGFRWCEGQAPQGWSELERRTLALVRLAEAANESSLTFPIDV